MSYEKYTKEDILQIIKEEDVKFIRLQFVDMFGTLKNVAITVERVEKALNGEVMFDGSSLEGSFRMEEADMYLIPDLDTFEIFPWRPHQGRVARLICDIETTAKEAFSGDPRKILKDVIQEAEQMGYYMKLAPEFEFFLFHTDENGAPTTVTHDNAGYFDLGPIDLGENVRRDIVLTLQSMGYEIEASHHEVAPGQHEIDFAASEALKSADDIATFKLVVKVLASKHGLHATFMPKPIDGMGGSGMHTNIGLYDMEGTNVFYEDVDTHKLSETGRYFIGGLLSHAKAVTAITNPTVNSYKRLLTGYEAPTIIGWAYRNNTSLIRIPTSRNQDTKIEYRSPDPSCNPYLAIAVMLKAGLDGIKNKTLPDEPMTQAELEKAIVTSKGKEMLPTTLQDAITELSKDTIICDALGDIYKPYQRAKMREWDEYNQIVHKWELDKYIGRY